MNEWMDRCFSVRNGRTELYLGRLFWWGQRREVGSCREEGGKGSVHFRPGLGNL